MDKEKQKKKLFQKKILKESIMKKSIKKKLLIGIISLSITITIILGTASGFLLYRETQNNIETRLTENAKAYSQAVQNAIQVYKTEIESVAAKSDITDKSKTLDERRDILAKMAEQYGFLEIELVDEKGLTTNNADISEREYFQQAMAGNTYISSPFLSKVRNTMILNIATKINNGNGDGVVFASLDSTTFSNMIRDVAVGDSGYGFIVDKYGKIVAHDDQATVDAETNYIEMAETDASYAGVAQLVQDMTALNSNVETVNFNGKHVSIGYTSIPNTDGWSIGICATQSELMVNFYWAIGITLGLSILFILLSIMMALRIATPIVKPVTNLVNRIVALSEGNLHSEVPEVHTGDEIEVLSQSFTVTVQALNSYIEEISFILGQLDQGDCTVETKQEYKGDFVQIKDSLKKIITNLNTTFTAIQDSASQVASGSDQVSSAAQALSSGATEQAATVEELGASVASVAQQAEYNTSSVSNATNYVEQASNGLAESIQRMEKLSAAMNEISESSQEISKITKLVEDIAFQTNILALNAAVEAARAGSAGKGFAVVADEVRNLAAKSAEAAKQTAALIQKSVVSVSEGEQLSIDALKLLDVVSEKSGLVDRSIREIESSSIEQASAIEQINQGLSQVSAVVQNNAATAEESSASSEELAAQAQILQTEVSKFKLVAAEKRSGSFLDESSLASQTNPTENTLNDVFSDSTGKY
ncbi:methyl-accepting chemotaxis protein [Scatolibacter rhodanostii]|uniref:methyl-accepting chemotaxis protein n=1 Tax=Scatolibacter rhodanostii TaxID=2014781 RepID=UPI000C0800DD|nr:methyl-accepting chemotaxis protein [Scatolibacter rhodanostii]